MADDLKNRGEPDRSRINVDEEHEMRYWTRELGVDEATLREAVKQFGTGADKVREAISTRLG